MAKYRQIHTDFWNDGFVLDLTPEEKYFYIYLMTNTSTAQCGIYELPKRIIETQTGYNRETVDKLIQRFEEYGKIHYCNETKEIMIINWVKYNQPGSPNAIKCVNKELKNIKNKQFIYELYKQCINLQLDVNRIFNGLQVNENKHLIRDSKGACKDIGSNKVISNKEEVISNKQEISCNNNKDYEESNDELEPKGEGETATTVETICEDSNFSLKDVIRSFEDNIHPTVPMEYEKLTKWSMKFNCDLVIMAIEEAVGSNVKNIRYIEKILYTWICNGITMPKDVQRYKKEWQNNKNKSKNTGSFDRENQRKYNFKEIERKLLGWDKEESG